jgi:hypothetical protein
MSALAPRRGGTSWRAWAACAGCAPQELFSYTEGKRRVRIWLA